MNIFSGVKVIDITKVFSGPFATRMLADYGAEVLKIETEANQDDSREFPPIKNGWSGYYELLNRNKKGIAIDLKNEDQRQNLYDLCKTADIFVENLTPSTKHKLKVDYETLKRYNPNIIYASLSGLGQTEDKKYYDVIAQAESGLLSLSGTPEMPLKIGPSVVDAFSGMTLAFSIASALFFKQETGKGQFIEVSMLGCAMNMLEHNLVEYSLTHTNPLRAGNQDTAIAPFGIYAASNGYIALAIGNDKLWQVLLGFLKQYTTIAEEHCSTNTARLANNHMLTESIEKVFANFTLTELCQKLTELNIPCSPVNTMAEVYDDEQNYLTQRLIKAHHSKLGEYVTSGKSIHFSEAEPFSLVEAPSIGQDDEAYGI